MSSGYPLSPLQEARWHLFQGEPRFPWGVSLRTSLCGPVEPDALRAALDRLVERYEILRTRFVRVDRAAAPTMSVEQRGRASFDVHDWSALSPAERERECLKVELELRSNYPLDGAAPLRALLARVGPHEHCLVLAQSSIATDWRSLWCLARELVRGLGETGPVGQPVLFADCAQWQRNALRGHDAATGLLHWQAYDLAGAAALRTPLEFDRGEAPFAHHEVSYELPPQIDEALAALARGKNVAVESLLLAAWQAWLARLARRDELVVGAASAGRAFQGLDDAVGPFSRLLPVRTELDRRTSLLRLARQADEQLARGAEWHEFFQPPLAQAAEGTFGYAFEALPSVEPFEHDGFRLEVLRRDGHGERFRALLRAEQRGEGTELRLAVDARWFSEADAVALAEPYIALLENALASPDAPLETLPAVGMQLRARLLAHARGPALDADPRTFPERFEEVASANPDAVAVHADGEELTYADLEQRSRALAAELIGLGIGPGMHVGVHLERSVDLFVGLLGVQRAGGAYVPLPPTYPRERVLTMLRGSGATVVVGSERSRAELDGFAGGFVQVRAPRPPHAEPLPRRAGPDDPAYVIFTSGSSGKPKGVPVSHANLAHSTRAREAYYPGRAARFLVLSSFAFDSSVAGIFWTFWQGGTIVLPPEGFEQDLASLPELIETTRPTHLLALPSLWALVLEQADAEQLASLETVVVAGESCPLELVKRHLEVLPSTGLYNEYGPTEGTVWATVFDARHPIARTQVPIGKPIPGSSAYVLTPARDLAPFGVAGELWVGGPGVVAGYLDRPNLTAERFAVDPFSGGRMYRTGDLARILPDGNLEFLGRLDHQVKIRGYRIELEEIESLLGTHPAVRDCVVVARTEDGRGTSLVAYVTPVGPRPAGTDLLRYLGERLPEYMVPAYAVCLDEWPLLPNGKLDRLALPAPDADGEHEEPEGALEVVLAALWADVLGVDEVGRHDDFFALGGHSLSATRLYARLKETLQVKVPLRALFEHRTPAALADEIRRDPVEAGRVEGLAEVVLSVLEGEEEEQALGA